MGKMVLSIFITWVCVVGAYIILATLQPVIGGITGEASAMLTATSNMTNYPGAAEVVSGFPFYMWLIPGAVGVIATVVEIKSFKAAQ